MKVNELKKISTINVCYHDTDRLIEGYYACDMLSWIMGHVKRENVVLITMLSNMNLIAVASLLGCSAIIFREGVAPSEEVIKQAKQEGIALFGSDLDALAVYEGIKAYETQL